MIRAVPCACRDNIAEVMRIRSGMRLAQCRACGLIARPDAPPPHALERFYDREYNRCFEAEQSGTRDNLQVHALRRIESRVRNLDRQPNTHPAPQGHLIDVGCGRGRLLHLARQAGWSVVGFDPSSDREIPGAAEIEIRRASWPIVNIADDSADAIVFLNVLDHLPDPLLALQAAWRALRPGGAIYVRVPNGPFHLRLLTGRWGRTLSAMTVFHLYGFGRRSLQHFLARTGFERIDIRTAPLSEGDAYASGTTRRTARSVAKHALKAGYNLSAWVGLDRWPWGPSIEALASKPNRSPDLMGRVGSRSETQDRAG
ncbi:MAG: class I SAM-dependent methyltransferase [Nitrospiraceae bacterium]